MENSARKNILFIQTEKLGDLINSLTFLSNVSGIQMDYKKFLVIDEKYSSGLFVDEFPFEIIPLNKNKYKWNLFYRVGFLNSLRKLNLKYAVNISPSRGVINDELTIHSNSKTSATLSLTSEFLPTNLLIRNNSLYTMVLNSDIKNEFLKLNELFKLVYKQNYNNEIKGSEFIKTVENKTIGENEYIIIAPVSAEQNRNWPPEKFKSLCEKLSEKCQVYLLGTSEQEETIQRIGQKVSNVKVFAGRLSIAECIHLIANALLFVGLDSGFSHIAQVLNTPYVAIIGGGKYERFFPYPDSQIAEYKFHKLECFNCNWNCIYTQPYCINLVTVDDVFESCLKLLNAK